MPSYYQRVVPSRLLPGAIGDIARAGAAAAAHGFPARAARYDRIVAVLLEELQEAGIQSSRIADAAIRAAIASTQVRPDNTGNLAKHVRSQPLPTAFPLGAIGIASIEELDKVINPRARNSRGRAPYWRAQEWGWNLTPRIVPGYFMPGFSAPDAAASRAHPYFEQMPYHKGMPALNIVETLPIPPRYFLREGAAVGVEANLKLRAAAERKATVALNAI